MAASQQNGVMLEDLNAHGRAPANVSSDDDTSLGSESILEPRETSELKTFDVFSLIVNKMIGTGIYSAPATVLLLTGNKSLTLGLFGIGFVYTLFSMFMYLDYAAALPYTGGELVYLDEVTAHSGHILQEEIPENQEPGARRPPAIVRPTTLLQKVFGDGLLAYVIYSLLFISIFNSGTNSMQTGRMILICIQAEPDPTKQPPLHSDLIRAIGVAALSILTIIQYFSAEAGRKLNRYLAVLKIVFLFILMIGGAVKTGGNLQGMDVGGNPIQLKDEWFEWYATNSKISFAKALLAILFSFEGWENATFVAGEVPRDHHDYLRKGFMWAVFIVGSLYLLVAALFLHAIPYENINRLEGGGHNVFYAPTLFDNSQSARRAWAILAAISSLGSLNSIIYTFSRVKQAIGQANILPWSRVWGKDDRIHRNDMYNNMHKTPQGGLILHWIMSVAVIAGSSSVKNVIEFVNLPGYLQTYTHCFILLILSAGFLRLKSREEALGCEPPSNIWRPSQATGIPRYLLAFILSIYGLLNLALLVINVIPPYRASDGKDSSFKGFGFLVILASMCTFGLAYRFLVFGATVRYFRARRVVPDPVEGGEGEGEVDYSVKLKEEGLWGRGKWCNLLNVAHVKAELWKDFEYDGELERVNRFGRRWKMRWVLDKKYRHPETEDPQIGAQAVNGGGDDARFPPPRVHLNFWYWFLGGRRGLDQDKMPGKRIKRTMYLWGA